MLVEGYLVLLLAQLLLHNGRGCNVRYCKVSEWSTWSSCSQQCGSGTQYRTRHKVVLESCGGDCYYQLREDRDCPKTCLNGGTPSFWQCYCKTGYSGSCCQFQSRRVKKDGNTKTNPPSQESSGTKCGTGCIAGICVGGGCCGTALILYFCWRKGCHESTGSVVNFICCNQGNATVLHYNNQVAPASNDSDQRTPGNPGEAPPIYTCDRNECQVNPNYCRPGGYCVNTHGSFRCLCGHGYVFAHGGTACVEKRSDEANPKSRAPSSGQSDKNMVPIVCGATFGCSLLVMGITFLARFCSKKQRQSAAAQYNPAQPVSSVIFNGNSALHGNIYTGSVAPGEKGKTREAAFSQAPETKSWSDYDQRTGYGSHPHDILRIVSPPPYSSSGSPGCDSPSYTGNGALPGTPIYG